MASIRAKDTYPELIVRRLVHALGYRYRLHDRSLSGSPDLVFPSRKKIVFVHGCFWHRHRCRRGQLMPASRIDYWKPKLEGNKTRDAQHRQELRRAGWTDLTTWECQTGPNRVEELKARLLSFLEP